MVEAGVHVRKDPGEGKAAVAGEGVGHAGRGGHYGGGGEEEAEEGEAGGDYTFSLVGQGGISGGGVGKVWEGAYMRRQMEPALLLVAS